MKVYLFLILFTSSLKSFSQKVNQNQYKEKSIELHLLKGKHSTGDLPSYGFDVSYSQQLKTRFSWSVFLGATLSSGKDLLLYTINNIEYDGSLLKTTGGLHAAGTINFDFLKSTKQSLRIGLGPVARYQSTSIYDDVTTLYPGITNLPMPVRYVINTTPANTFAVGGRIYLGYCYAFKNNITLGAIGSFQIDSNGDNIMNIGITVGKRFSRIF